MHAAAPRFDARDFRLALGRFATGVTIITARGADGTPVGITANSFNSVSMDPPMVLWSLAKTARSLPVFSAASQWNVHILANDQEALSNRFARAGEDKFAALELDTGAGEAPLIQGCSARFQCRTAFCYEGGDHLIFVGEVVAYDRSERAPLLFVTGGYALAAKVAGNVSTGADADAGSAPYSENLLGYLLGRAHYQFVAGFRRTLDERGLDDAAFFVLSLLAVRAPFSAAEIAAHIAYTGIDVGAVLLDALVARGLLRCDAGGYALAERGRDAILHVMAAAKGVEADVVGRLGEIDAAALRNALKRLIAVSDPGLPKLWV
ncbi:MAG: flavin reductase [Burkholderiales bacterium]|nr:flavin reductase [Burkholderiales bacterium]MDE1926064.1 flavin reductase [Burkholderiales bacterium]MDE2159551.1 flavin reductase [Burkholderiales bacterium]MDE2502074.1 flavin reductase [Burkholderiales bacterium]